MFTHRGTVITFAGCRSDVRNVPGQFKDKRNHLKMKHNLPDHTPLSKEELHAIKAGDTIERMLGFDTPVYLKVKEVTEGIIDAGWIFNRDTGLEIDEHMTITVSYIRRVLTEEMQWLLDSGIKTIPYPYQSMQQHGIPIIIKKKEPSASALFDAPNEAYEALYKHISLSDIIVALEAINPTNVDGSKTEWYKYYTCQVQGEGKKSHVHSASCYIACKMAEQELFKKIMGVLKQFAQSMASTEDK